MCFPIQFCVFHETLNKKHGKVKHRSNSMEEIIETSNNRGKAILK